MASRRFDKVYLCFFVAWYKVVLSVNQNCWLSGFTRDSVTCRGWNFTQIPDNLPSNITKLYLSDTSIEKISHQAFFKYTHIRELHIRNFTRLTTIEPGAFRSLTKLRILWIIDCLKLAEIKTGALGLFQELNTLKITKSGLVEVPDFSLFETKSKEHNGTMYEIDLSSNSIEVINSGAFKSVKTWLLRLENNDVKEIQDRAFAGSNIAKLDFNNNLDLAILGDLAFDGIHDLRSLNLSKTKVSYLPTVGLSTVEDLNLENTPTLQTFPSVLKFAHIKIARLTYAHHCCAFKHPDKQDPQLWKAYEFQETVRKKCEAQRPTASKPEEPLTPSNPSDMGGISRRRSTGGGAWGSFAPLPINTSSDRDDTEINNNGFFPFKPTLKGNNTINIVACGKIARAYSEVVCTPQPNAFNPCEDVMGYEWLRIVVWFVLLAALLGNLVVILVIITGGSKMTVPKFLMCNLSVADFLMGLYLLLIASMDVHSLGEYFNHAITWQNDGGCQVAGFLTVFASELSIFVLTVITIERWYAISYAMYAKKLKLRQASLLMLLGWCYATFMASLPLMGISGYGTVSICLPMEANDLLDKCYICSLLILNGVAFIVICCCYVHIYFNVQHNNTTARTNDATIAKRMAILVFTNFVCWAPIAFFGLTASAGFPLIDITNSKILLVFFYPLNSCANPFLYVILTKQFRKDVFILLGKYGVCTERANRYKETYTCSKSMSQSRNNGLHLHHNQHHASDLSFITHVTHVTHIHKGSKILLNGSSLLGGSGIGSSHTKQLQSARIQAMDQNLNANGAWSNNDKNKERKLCTVPESSPVRDDYDCETILDGTEGMKDILEARGTDRVRSASEYVILYPPCQKEIRRRAGRYDKQSSLDTTISSGTETSYLSDSSVRNSVDVEKIHIQDRQNGGQNGDDSGRKKSTSTQGAAEKRSKLKICSEESSTVCPSSDEEDMEYHKALL